MLHPMDVEEFAADVESGPDVTEVLRPPRGAPDHPAKKLMLAVLQDGLSRMCCGIRRLELYGRLPRAIRPRAFAELQLWFKSDSVAQPFTLVRICEALEIDVRKVRRALERYRSNPVPLELELPADA